MHTTPRSRKKNGSTYGPVALDPVLEAQCRALSHAALLSVVGRECKDGRTKGRVGLGLVERLFCTSSCCTVGRESGEEESGKGRHGGRAGVVLPVTVERGDERE